MALITLCSVKGAPGVTSAALAMTLTWPRPALLVEADTAGGSSVMAGFFRGQVSQERSLLSLAIAAPHSSIEQVLWSQCIQLPGSESKSLLSAPPTVTQARLTKRIWVELADVLSGLDRGGVDVIVDAGRLSTAGAAMPLIERSDAILLTTTGGLPALHSALGSVAFLQNHLDTTGTGADALGLLLRTGDVGAYGRSQVASTLQAPVLASLPDAPGDARVYSHGLKADRRHDHSDYLRSVRRAGVSVRELIDTRGERLRRPSAEEPAHV
jgi:hypothetical protein